MVKLSIILPVYNVDKFVGYCLESLLKQNLKYEEYEIICVIDGSPDNSKEIIEQYAKEYPNIRIFEQENSGVCVARNNGFMHAKGKYIWFVDPDDMIAANCIGEIVNLMDNNEADVFEFDYKTCPEDESFSGKEIDFDIDEFNKSGSSGAIWLTVCRKDYLVENNITFNEAISYGEDYLWAFQIKYRKHNNIYSKATLYTYRQRENSAMHNQSFEKREKHYKDMVMLYSLYGTEYQRCKRENMDMTVLTNICRRRQLCVESALWNLMKLGYDKEHIKRELEELKKIGAYPYKLMFWNLFGKSVVNPVKYRMITFLFPIEKYYLFIAKLFSSKG